MTFQTSPRSMTKKRDWLTYFCLIWYMNFHQLYNFTETQQIYYDLRTLSPGVLTGFTVVPWTPRANPPLASTSLGKVRAHLGTAGMGKGGKPCCPVAQLWGRAWGRRAGEWHMRIKNLQRRVNGNSCLCSYHKKGGQEVGGVWNRWQKWRSLLRLPRRNSSMTVYSPQ